MATPTSPDAQPQLDNRAKQLNKNSDAFWQSRGYASRPPDWQTRDPNSPPPQPTKTSKK